MGKLVVHEGYKVESCPMRATDSDKWQLRIFISLEDHRGVRTREFVVDSLYGTQQEADIHGIAFGQRIIDGKVQGQSVMDLTIADRRATPRFRVQFRATFAGAMTLEGKGILHDLSVGGCRIESAVGMETGLSLELRIHVPDFEWPLRIETARTQWVSGQVFGLAFFQLSRSEQQRLDQVITAVMKGILPGPESPHGL